MTNKEIRDKSFKYFIYSLLAWDHKNRKVEDDPRNNCYFFSPEYKKSFTKDLELARKKNIIKINYLGNDITSTNFNVYEKNDGEVIIAFRGSDSKIDWQSDFSYFKQKFKDENVEKLLSMSSEDFNNLCIDEYIKSRESAFDKSIKFFQDISKFNLNQLSNNLCMRTNGINDSNKINLLADRYGSKIEFHGGFIKQYKTIYDQVNRLIDNYINDKRFNKIIFCGHSLGASLAQLAFIFQSMRYPENNFECYIAGTPKIGNIFLNKFINESEIGKKIYIMNIDSDMVSMVPPDKFGFYRPKNDVEITSIKAPFKTKFDHTLFYYLYCIKNKAPIKINNK